MIGSGSNPFSTRFVRPGTITWVEGNVDVDRLVAQFEANQFCGQIVGPHGCGKSTLAHEVARRVCQRFATTRFVSIRRIGLGLEVHSPGEPLSVFRNTLLVIDGFQYLPLVQRWLLKRSCLKSDLGIIVTTHRHQRWPKMVTELKPTLDIFQQVCERLQLDVERKLDSRSIATAFALCDGNCREALMALYDKYESKFDLVGTSGVVDTSVMTDLIV